MKKKQSPNQIPEAHLEEDNASAGDETGEQVPDRLAHERRNDRRREGGNSPRKGRRLNRW